MKKDNIIEDIDEKLMQFHKETGIWPPGKDRPAEMAQDPFYEVMDIRIKAFKYWWKQQQLKDLLEKLHSINMKIGCPYPQYEKSWKEIMCKVEQICGTDKINEIKEP